MRLSTLARTCALAGAGALLVCAPATASAQPGGPIDTTSLEGSLDIASMVPGSLAGLAGGGLASVGSGDLGSAVAGGQCVVVDPTLGSASTSIEALVVSKEGSPGVAQVSIEGGSWFSNTSGIFHWTNTTTHETGDVPFGPFGGDAPFTNFDVETGAGTVEWSIDGTAEGIPLSLVFPIALTGSAQQVPLSSAPYSTCTGSADIA